MPILQDQTVKGPEKELQQQPPVTQASDEEIAHDVHNKAQEKQAMLEKPEKGDDFDKLDEQKEEAGKKKLRKKQEEPMSIEKGVKVNKRNAAKPKDSEYEYDTPKTKPQKKKEEKSQIIFDTDTWKNLHNDLKLHYKMWLDKHKEENE